LTLEIEPDSANTNHAYGLFLIRSGKQKEALEYLEAAIGKENSTPRHIYVYAVALDSRGQTAAAMEIINRQSKRWPNNLELPSTYNEQSPAGIARD
jgi:predicted Zn-dependent protease